MRRVKRDWHSEIKKEQVNNKWEISQIVRYIVKKDNKGKFPRTGRKKLMTDKLTGKGDDYFSTKIDIKYWYYWRKIFIYGLLLFSDLKQFFYLLILKPKSAFH